MCEDCARRQRDAQPAHRDGPSQAGFARLLGRSWATLDDSMSVVGYPEVVAALPEWSGCWAEVWDYTTSHDVLRIKLGRRNREQCAVLVLIACGRVSFVDSWDGFRAAVREYEGPYGKRYQVTDGKNLDVDCGNLYLSGTLGSYADIPSDPNTMP